MIYWSEFSWEAFATLATGLAAVAAAWWIGRKQTRIQEAQIEVQQLTLRSQLFDRRYRVYEFTRNFLLKSFTVGDEDLIDFRAEWVQDFQRALGESRILFSPEVFPQMDEIWRQAIAYNELKGEMARLFRDYGHYGKGNPTRQGDAMRWSWQRIETLPELFSELNLSSLVKPKPNLPN